MPSRWPEATPAPATARETHPAPAQRLSTQTARGATTARSDDASSRLNSPAGPITHDCSESPWGRSDGPVRLFYDSCRLLTTRRLGQQRGAQTHHEANKCPGFETFGLKSGPNRTL